MHTPRENPIAVRVRRFWEDPEAFRNLGRKLPSGADEFGAIALIVLGIITLSALLNPVGDAAVSSSLANGLRQTFGIGAYVISLTVLGLGIILLLSKARFNITVKFDWMQILAIEIAFVSLQGLFHLLAFDKEGRALARAGSGGGYVGWAISSLLSGILGTYLAIFALCIALGYSLILALHLKRSHLRQALQWVGSQSQELSVRLRPAAAAATSNGIIHQTVSAAPSRMAEPARSALSPTEPSAPSALSASPIKIEIPYTQYAHVDVLPPAPSSEIPPDLPGQTPSGRRPTGRTGRSALPTPPPPLPRLPKDEPRLSAAEKLPGAAPQLEQPVSALPVVPDAPLPGTAKPEEIAPVTSPIPEEERYTPPFAGSDEFTRIDTDSPYLMDEEELLEEEVLPIPSNGPRRLTLTINGQVIERTLPEAGGDENESLKSGLRPGNGEQGVSNGKRYFTVDGFQDRVKLGERNEHLPPLELLRYSELKLPSEEEVNHNARIIEHTMLEFDIDADVIDVRVGPTVTQYALSPIKEVINENGERVVIRTRVGKITALASDLALALSAKSVRIEAPVPGHSYVGVEVPNREPSIVSLRSVLESEAFYKERHKPLAVPLGRDVSGEPIIMDLASMPHLLVAGTTGSGKSVCLTAMISSLVMHNTPERLRMIILDPKMVEMVHFNGLPHLLGPVETDTERIIGVLRWATREMDRRYKLLEHENARHLDAYNKTVAQRGEEPLPYIVIFIDEIGDLMMMRPDETEKTVTRLAQKARAAGMHLVIATQRPSVDVITGLIKANFPARISFAVASGMDSRVILDAVGAETLVGKGDMLFLAPDAAGPKRLQGCYVSDEELYEIVMYWRAWHEEALHEAEQPMDEPQEDPGMPPWERGLTRLEELNEHDPVLEEALTLVVQEGEASASLIQRRLGVGYPRAARLMDSLHELGIIGEPLAGGRSRRVLVKSVEQARRMVNNNRRKR